MEKRQFQFADFPKFYFHDPIALSNSKGYLREFFPWYDVESKLIRYLAVDTEGEIFDVWNIPEVIKLVESVKSVDSSSYNDDTNGRYDALEFLRDYYYPGLDDKKVKF